MARLTAPLTDLLRKGVAFTWGEKEHAAFSALKNVLCSPPILRIADPHRPFEVVTDASDIAIGAILLQDFGNCLQPIANESRKLHPPDKNYPIHAREMLAIVHAFKFAAAKGVYYVEAGTNQIWVPGYTLLRELLLQEAHDGITSGHFGVEKTRQQLQRYYYWPEMLTDVQRHVASCPTCQLMKLSRKRPAGQLQPIPPPERAWQQVTMDFVTRLSARASGNDVILVVVDRLTKMAHFAACKKSITAEETARLFISTIVRLHGIPAAIISDRDTKFTSNFWWNLWQQFGMRLQFSSSYHHETDGQTERTNQTMEQLIRATSDDPTTWEQQLPLIEFAYSNSPSATTQQSPFYLNYGQDPVVPMTPNLDNPVPRAQQFAEILQAARTRAAEAIKKANVIAKRNADRHRIPVTYQPDDLVLLDTQNLRLPIIPKLRPRYCRPFRMSHMIIPVIAHLLLPADWYVSPSFHVSLLRPYVPSTSQLPRNRPASMTRPPT
ncbi:unnamed protein product [Closterium sp. NIES-53]